VASGEPAASGEPGASEVRVAPGDTAGAIAARVKPASASVDQTLAALYQANPDAFMGSVHRLKANSTLKVPGAADIAAIDPAKARELVLGQSADFAAYRSRLAEAARDAGGERAGQSAQGKVGARVEDKRDATAQDQLKISRSGTADGAGPKNQPVGQAGAEQNAAREAAVRESQNRIQSLEKNVGDLQKLLELRGRQIAELQKQIDDSRGAAAPAAPKVEPAPAKAEEPAPQPAAPKAEEAPVEAPKPPVAAAAPMPAPAPPPAPASDSFVDDLLDNPYTLPGLGGILALGAGFGWYAMRRRRKAQAQEDALVAEDGLTANSLFGSTGGQSVDTSTAFTGSGADTGADSQSTEVDPIAEAEVYIAYGREAQAEEILREALRKQPKRQAIRAKLLEIYSGRKDVAAFGDLAAEMHEMTGGQNEEWPKVVSMGLALDPDNPLYSARATTPPAGDAAQGLFDNESLDPAAGDAGKPAGSDADLAFDLDLEGGPKTELAKAVDGRFELPDLELDTPRKEPADFDLDLPEIKQPVAAAAQAAADDAELGLDLDTVTSPEDKQRLQEMGTKLDLASAYEEIGDKEGARELLDEVLAGGDDEQRQRAREMLDRLV
jgi:pilus assembly protein FimV